MTSASRIDADAVRDAVPLADLIGRYTNLTRDGHEFRGLCPFHKEKTPSFHVVPAKGFYHCFGCGAHGDAIDFVIEKHGVGFREACAIIAGENVLPAPGPIERRDTSPAPDLYAGYRPIVPVPSDAPPIVAGKRTAPILNPKRADDPEKREQPYKPALVHPYRTEAGDLIGYVIRVDFGNGRKITPAIMFCETPDGERRWCLRKFPEPRGLYNLPVLAERPNAVVVLVEGEKAADAAARILPKQAVLTWPGGTQSISRVDWAPLAGRKVVLWPDADEPGRKAMADIAEHLTGMGCTVTIADTSDQADGDDAADLPDDTDGMAWLKPRLRPFARRESVDEEIPIEYPADIPPDLDDREPTDESTEPRTPGSPVALGYDHGRYYYLSQADGQVHMLTASQHTQMNLMALASMAHYWERTNFMGKRGVAWTEAADWLMQCCRERGVYSESRLRGRGAYWDLDHAILHLGDRMLVDGEETRLDALSTWHVYEASERIDVAYEHALSSARASRLIDLCDLLTLEASHMSILLAGWIVTAPICGALPWRTHLWITGERGSGKSYLIDSIIKPLVGNIGVAVQGNTTEPGIRQILGIDARPIIFDEAEGEDGRDRERLQAVLNLARQASSEGGAPIVKGSTSGAAKTYRIRSMFCFSSINTGVSRAADESRVVQIAFAPKASQDARAAADRFEEIRTTVAELITPEFVGGLLARTLKLLPIIRANGDTFARAWAERFGSRRDGDTHGILLAGAASLHNSKRLTLDDAREFLQSHAWVQRIADNIETEADHDRALNHLLEQMVRYQADGGLAVEKPVIEMIADARSSPLSRTADALAYQGIRVRDDMVWFAQGHARLNQLFRDTPWALSWRNVLLQMPGASRSQPAVIVFGQLRKKAIGVPILSVLKQDQ